MSHPITRRTFVQATTTSLALPATLACRSAAEEPAEEDLQVPSGESAGRQPVVFVSHGAPDLALDPGKGADLTRMAEAMPMPTAVLVLSAHWERTPVRIGTVAPRELIHDYGGFAAELREVRHDAPTAPDLAARVARLLEIEHDPRPRGWDHGVWVPLVHMDPGARLPVLQLSLPTRLPGAELISLGRRLAPLRDEGVLVLGSGGLVHNLGALDWSGGAPAPTWATEFEDWTRTRLAAHDLDRLAAFTDHAPALREAHPTLEHFQPLLVALGASTESDAVTFPVGGFEYGSLSRTAVRFG